MHPIYCDTTTLGGIVMDQINNLFTRYYTKELEKSKTKLSMTYSNGKK